MEVIPAHDACESGRKAISAAIDGSASEVELASVARHVQTCAECRGFQFAAAAVAADVRRAEPLRPGRDLIPSRSPRTRRRWRRASAAVGAAAALAGAAWLGASTPERAAHPQALPPHTMVVASRDLRTLLVLRSEYASGRATVDPRDLARLGRVLRTARLR
jgi:hypothetical protein